MHHEMLDIWVVEQRLGGGGMGTVYRCHNRDARRIQAAIKVLDPRFSSSSDIRRRFVREAELLFELDHPHIVKVRNVRMDADPPFIEMAFVEGASLAEHLEGGALAPGAAARGISSSSAASARDTSMPAPLSWPSRPSAAMAPQHVPRIVAVALLGCLALFFMIASLNTARRSSSNRVWYACESSLNSCSLAASPGCLSGWHVLAR